MQVALLASDDRPTLYQRFPVWRSSIGLKVSAASSAAFLASAALQKGAVLNYVNDSAPMHFASAVNAPVVAIYCSTVPDFGYGPLSDTSFIIETKQSLSCRPCGLHGKKQCPLKHFNCAETITMEQIYQPLQQVLHN